jgi:hypothetical protein
MKFEKIMKTYNLKKNLNFNIKKKIYEKKIRNSNKILFLLIIKYK